MSSMLFRPAVRCSSGLHLAKGQAFRSRIARSYKSTRPRKTTAVLVAPVIALGSLLATVHCEPASSRPYARDGPVENPEESIVNVYQLGFGSVAGICVGVFVKKGLKAVAFFLGGTFVLLQYFASRSLVKVDWSKISSRYESAVDAAAGPRREAQSRAGAIWTRFTDFVLADVPARGTFLAGMALGLRIG